MATPRPQKVRPWKQADHDENARRIQRDQDQKIWDRLARLLKLRGRDFAAAFGRLLDDRIAAALRAHSPPLIDQLKSPVDADALRGALFDAISDDVVEMFQILTGQGTNDERSDKEETSGSGEPNAAFEQREIYPSEEEEDEDGDPD